MGQGTFREVQNGSGDPRGGLGQVEGTLVEVRHCQGTLGEAQDGLRRCETGKGTLEEVRDGLGTWGRSATGRETFGGGPGRVGEVQNG